MTVIINDNTSVTVNYGIDTEVTISWVKGLSGPQGPTGPTGNTGPTGQQGIQGIQGPTGSQGDQGSQGPTGSQGPIGTGGVLGYYGSFFDTTTQIGSSTNGVVYIGKTTSSNGISLSGFGQMVIANPGTYKMTFSIQLVNADNTIHYADIWLKLNGSNYPDSNTRFFIPARKDNTGHNGYAVATLDFIGTSINPNDYVEIWWVSDSTQVSIATIAAYDSVPEAPGVIVNVSQVMYTQLGPTGPTGPLGPTGPTGALTTASQAMINLILTGF